MTSPTLWGVATVFRDGSESSEWFDVGREAREHATKQTRKPSVVRVFFSEVQTTLVFDRDRKREAKARR